MNRLIAYQLDNRNVTLPAPVIVAVTSYEPMVLFAVGVTDAVPSLPDTAEKVRGFVAAPEDGVAGSLSAEPSPPGTPGGKPVRGSTGKPGRGHTPNFGY